jgi:hypothetical protein
MKRIPRAVLKPCWSVEVLAVCAKTGVKPTSDLLVRATSEGSEFVMARLSHDSGFLR